MFSFLLFSLFSLVFAVALLAPENIISVLIGVLGTLGVTHYIKSWTGLYGFGATVLAFAVALVIGIITVVAQMAMSGEFTAAALLANATSIFTFATLAYRALELSSNN